MLKANRKTLIITSIVTIVPVLIGIICWNRLPDVMATHFGMNNEANQTGFGYEPGQEGDSHERVYKKQLEVPVFCFKQLIDRRILYWIIHS